MRRSLTLAPFVVVLMFMTSSCALSPTGFTEPGAPAPETLTISPSTANVRAGSTQQFTPSPTTMIDYLPKTSATSRCDSGQQSAALSQFTSIGLTWLGVASTAGSLARTDGLIGSW